MAEADWLPGFTRRFLASVDPSKVSANVSGFQVHMRIAADAGYDNDDLTRLFDDLRFTPSGEYMIAVTLADGITQVPVEIAMWDWVNEKAHLWVGPAALDTDDGLDLYLYWNSGHMGNGANVGDQWSGTPSAPWDDGTHLLVNHMADGPAVTYIEDELDTDDVPDAAFWQGVATDEIHWYAITSMVGINGIRKYLISDKSLVASNLTAYDRVNYAFSTGAVIDGKLLIAIRDEGSEDDARIVEYQLEPSGTSAALSQIADHDIAYSAYQYPESIAKHSMDSETVYYWVMFGGNGNADFDNGTSEGADDYWLSDTDKSWTPNEWIGSTITCNGKTMIVTSNTETLLVGTGGWSGGGNPGSPQSYTLEGGRRCAVVRYDYPTFANPVAYDLYTCESGRFGGQEIKFVTATDFLTTPHGKHGNASRIGYLERWHWNGTGFELVTTFALPADGAHKLGQGFVRLSGDDDTWYFAARDQDGSPDEGEDSKLMKCTLQRYTGSLWCPDSSTNSDEPDAVSTAEGTSPTQQADDETGHRQDFESTGSEKLNCGQGSQLRSFTALTMEALISVESFLTADEGKNSLMVLQRGPFLQVRGDGNNAGKVAFYAFGLSDVGYHFSHAADTVDPGGTELAVATLYHIMLAWDGTTIRLYIDGVENTAGDFPVAATGTTTFESGDYHSIGAEMSPTAYRFFDGQTMEVRVADEGKSAAWALASNHNMRDSLLSWGPLETFPSGPDHVRIRVSFGASPQSLPRLIAAALRRSNPSQVA